MGPLHDRKLLNDVMMKHGYKPHKKDNYSATWHPDGHVMQAYSDDTWKHLHKDGKGVKEGKGHAELDKHLSSLHSTQHTEEEVEELEVGHVTAERAQELFANNPELYNQKYRG